MKFFRLHLIVLIFSSCSINTKPEVNNNMDKFRYKGDFSFKSGAYPAGGDEFRYSSACGLRYTSGYPAQSDLVEAVLSDSNFDFSKSMMDELVALIFWNYNSECPDGSSFKANGNKCSMHTVGPGGELWLLEVKKDKTASFNVKLTKKSKYGKYPGLVRVG